MIHLGRFVLIEFNGITGEGYTLMRSECHKITGTYRIMSQEKDFSIGCGEVIRIGEKYYIDVYDGSEKSYLTDFMNKGKKKFITHGTVTNIERNKTFSYKLSYIELCDEIYSNFQVDKFSVVMKKDLKCRAYLSSNWLKKYPPFDFKDRL